MQNDGLKLEWIARRQTNHVAHLFHLCMWALYIYVLNRFSRRARRAFIAVAGCRARSLPAMEPTPSTTTPPAIMSDLSLSALPRRSKGITSFYVVEVKGTPLVHYFDADIFPTFDAMYEVKFKIETATGTYKRKMCSLKGIG